MGVSADGKIGEPNPRLRHDFVVRRKHPLIQKMRRQLQPGEKIGGARLARMPAKQEGGQAKQPLAIRFACLARDRASRVLDRGDRSYSISGWRSHEHGASFQSVHPNWFAWSAA